MLETFGKGGATLQMHANVWRRLLRERSEKVHLRLQIPGQGGEIEKWSRALGQTSPHQIEPQRIGENENSLFLHKLVSRYCAASSVADAKKREIFVMAETRDRRAREHAIDTR